VLYMSGGSQRGLSDRIRTAFSFSPINDDDDDDDDDDNSEVEFVEDVSGSPVPFTPREDEERPFGSFEQVTPPGGDQQVFPTSSDSPKTKKKMATSSSSSSTPSSGSITIGGRVINISTTARTHSVGTGPLFKKESRSLLPEDKRNDLFDKATRARSTKFDLVTLTLSEEDKLDDTYSIGIQLAQVKNHFIKYDMDDVFMIVTPYVNVDDETKLRPSYTDLFTGYSQLTEEQVARSNAWYNQHTIEDYYRQNLQLTFEFFENNCTKDLWEKCLEDYDEYEQEEKGGTLFFIIMMKKLQRHTDSAVQPHQQR
jgi:hypothetical protein